MSTPAISTPRLPRLTPATLTKARLRVVPRTRRTAGRVPFLMLVTTLLVGGVVGLLMFNTSMQQASFATADLEEQAVALRAKEQSLAQDLEQLRNPQRIAEKAQRMGMVLAGPPTFLRLPDGTVLGTDAAATADSTLRLHERPPSLPPSLEPRAPQQLGPPPGVMIGAVE